MYTEPPEQGIVYLHNPLCVSLLDNTEKICWGKKDIGHFIEKHKDGDHYALNQNSFAYDVVDILSYCVILTLLPRFTR